ncbi:MAG: hypothetical protein ACRDT4_10005 [Micromonosporaceae bacterium]
MDPKLLIYLAYLAISIGLTVAVAHVLFRYGKVFLSEVFGDAKLADSVNRLLVVGFYLISLGYVAVTIRSSRPVESASQGVELLSLKLGWVLLGVGALHALNLYALSRIRRRRLAERSPPPPRHPARAAYPTPAWPQP